MRAEVVAPDALEDQCAGQHLARVAQEQLEQRELGAGQLDRRARRGDASRVRGSSARSSKASVSSVPAVPARRSSARSARQQLLEREGLDEVVVGAGVEPGDAVGHVVARGQHQHRRAVAARAQPPADLEPVDLRHQHVEHDRVGGSLRERGERLAPVGGERDLVALEPQRALERLAHGGLVVHDEQAHRSQSDRRC